MSMQVLSAVKPALPYRGILGAALLFLIATVLAFTLSNSRSHDQLSQRFSQPGWPISFRAPKRFHHQQQLPINRGAALLLGGKLRDGNPAILAVYQLDQAQAVAIREVAELILKSHLQPGSTQFTDDDVIDENVKLGPFDAIEIRTIKQGLVVRAAKNENGRAFAILLGMPLHSLTEDAYRLFDLTCTSVQPILP